MSRRHIAAVVATALWLGTSASGANDPNRPLVLGTHALLEISDAPFDVLNSTELVTRALSDAARAAAFDVVGEHSHAFPVQGVSAVFLIRCAWPPRMCSRVLTPLPHTTLCAAAPQRVAPVRSHVAGARLCCARHLHVQPGRAGTAV